MGLDPSAGAQVTHRRPGVLCCALPVCWHPCAPPSVAGDGPTREDGDQLLELGVAVCGVLTGLCK
jgi:hypothetical protein